MSLVTRCPACQTLFRVTAEQLKLQAGQVRCGRCMTVFDGYAALASLEARAPEHLVPDAPAVEPQVTEAATEPLAEAPSVEAAAAVPEQAAEVEAATPHELPPVEPPAVTAPVTPAPAKEAPVTVVAAEPAAATATAHTPIESSAEMSAPARSAPDTTPAWSGALEAKERRTPRDSSPLSAAAADRSLFHGPIDVRRSRRRPLWTAGSALLLLVLLAQGAYGWRDEISARLPALRPAYTAACGALGCTVNLPQNPKLINIEASDLQVIDPARPSVIELTATLRNHAGHTLGYPALDLVLTDSKEHALARRIFLPAEYVSAAALQTGVVPNAEVTVRLTMETGDLGASGFRLDLLPAR